MGMGLCTYGRVVGCVALGGDGYGSMTTQQQQSQTKQINTIKQTKINECDDTYTRTMCTDSVYVQGYSHTRYSVWGVGNVGDCCNYL